MDWRTGLDTVASADDRTLVERLLSPKAVLSLALALYGASIAALLLCISRTGSVLLPLGMAGLLLGVGYTARFPWSLKGLGLGDVAVFLAFGPVLMAGVALSVLEPEAVAGACPTLKLDLPKQLHAVDTIMRSSLSPQQLLHSARCAVSTVPALGPMSIGLGALTAAIVHANNARDVAADSAAGTVTLAARLGSAGSAAAYSCLLALAGLACSAGLLLQGAAAQRAAAREEGGLAEALATLSSGLESLRSTAKVAWMLHYPAGWPGGVGQKQQEALRNVLAQQGGISSLPAHGFSLLSSLLTIAMVALILWPRMAALRADFPSRLLPQRTAELAGLLGGLLLLWGDMLLPWAALVPGYSSELQLAARVGCSLMLLFSAPQPTAASARPEAKAAPSPAPAAAKSRSSSQGKSPAAAAPAPAPAPAPASSKKPAAAARPSPAHSLVGAAKKSRSSSASSKASAAKAKKGSKN